MPRAPEISVYDVLSAASGGDGRAIWDETLPNVPTKFAQLVGDPDDAEPTRVIEALLVPELIVQALPKSQAELALKDPGLVKILSQYRPRKAVKRSITSALSFLDSRDDEAPVRRYGLDPGIPVYQALHVASRGGDGRAIWDEHRPDLPTTFGLLLNGEPGAKPTRIIDVLLLPKLFVTVLPKDVARRTLEDSDLVSRMKHSYPSDVVDSIVESALSLLESGDAGSGSRKREKRITSHCWSSTLAADPAARAAATLLQGARPPRPR